MAYGKGARKHDGHARSESPAPLHAARQPNDAYKRADHAEATDSGSRLEAHSEYRRGYSKFEQSEVQGVDDLPAVAAQHQHRH